MVYEGRLRSKRKSETIYPWKAMSHICVEGVAERDSQNSFYNQHEASAIATWLAENASSILERGSSRYGNVSLSDLVGIVTPFRGQRNLLVQLLAEAGQL